MAMNPAAAAPLRINDALVPLRRSLTACLALARRAATEADGEVLAEAERALTATSALERAKVDPFLVASTAHLAPSERDDIDLGGKHVGPFLVIAIASWGWILHLPLEADPDEEPASESALALASYMREHGFDYVYLDADVDPIDGLPVHEE